jgi:hypothetical protein
MLHCRCRAAGAHHTPPLLRGPPHLWLQRHLPHVRLCGNDLVLGLQSAVGLVLQITDGARQVEVAVDAAHAADLRQEAAFRQQGRRAAGATKRR